MAVNTYISFNGNCRQAVSFYADVFQTEPPEFITYGSHENDFPLPDAVKDLIMHTELNIMDGKVMFSDSFDSETFKAGNNISIMIGSDDKEVLKTVFHRLKDGGEVVMPLQETFWSSLYGYVTDKFGIGWQINHEAANDSNADPGSE